MRSGARRGILVPAVVAAGPFLLLALRILVDGRDPLLSGDHALIDLAVRDLPGRQLGVYSRYGFFHPGPAMFWALGPAMWLTGGATWALPLGTQLVQAAAMATLVWVAGRRGGSAAAWAAAGAVLAYVLAVRVGLLHVPWNPLQAALPVALMLVAAAAVETAGPAAGVAVLAGTFSLHAHAGTAPVVALGAGLVVLWAALGWRRERRMAAPGATVALLAATVLLWVPPLFEQLTHEPGNLGRLARFSADGRDDRAGWNEGFAIAGHELAVVPFGIQSRGALTPPEFNRGRGRAGFVAFAVAATALWLIARRGRQAFAARLALVAAAGLLAAWAGAAAIDGIPYWYLGVWMTAPAVPLLIGWAVVLAEAGGRAAGAGAKPGPGAAPGHRGSVLVAVVGLLGVMAVIAAGRVDLHDDYAFPNEPGNRREVRAVTPLVLEAAEEHERVVLDGTADDLVHRIAAVAIQLEARGVRAEVTRRFEPYFGRDRVAGRRRGPRVTLARAGETAPGRLAGSAAGLDVWVEE